jgi:hypothetical protein
MNSLYIVFVLAHETNNLILLCEVNMLNMLFCAFLLALPCTPEGSLSSSDQPVVVSSLPVQDDQQRPREKLFASLTKYHVGVLQTGPKWTDTSEKEIRQRVKKNASQLAALVKSGKLLGVAEVADISDWKLLVFFKTESEKEAREILDGTKAVKEGLLKSDMYTVWGPRGLGAGLKKEKKERSKAMYYLTILSKGNAWKEKPDEDQGAFIDVHASNVLKLKDAGVLKFYGAVDGSGAIRNLSIVSAQSVEDVKTKLAAGPLIQKEWFVAKVLTCRIAEGTLP